jgi:hypothetical protein
MLSVRIQAIDGKRTFTFLDLRPYRLLQGPTLIIDAVVENLPMLFLAREGFSLRPRKISRPIAEVVNCLGMVGAPCGSKTTKALEIASPVLARRQIFSQPYTNTATIQAAAITLQSEYSALRTAWW